MNNKLDGNQDKHSKYIVLPEAGNFIIYVTQMIIKMYNLIMIYYS